MEILTRQLLANTAAARWMEAYCPDGKWRSYGIDSAAVYQALVDLGSNPVPDAVDAVIGHRFWTDIGACHECGKEDAPALIMVGEELDYESRTANICGDCLELAASKARAFATTLKP